MNNNCRQQANSTILPLPVYFGILFILILFVLVIGAFFNPYPVYIVIIIITIMVVVTYGHHKLCKEKEIMEEKIRFLVGKHLDTLARKRLISVRKDEYGIEDDKLWNKEINYFIDNVIIVELNKNQQRNYIHNFAKELIENSVLLKMSEIRGTHLFRKNMSASEFELLCASILEQVGWKCNRTRATGDQGADIIARKNGHYVILQCKMYSSKIGNKAVQEVVAAKLHLRGTSSVVVGTGEYTPSVKQLAFTTGTLLLHYTELYNLEERLSNIDIV